MNNDKNIHRSTSRALDILELVAANPSKYTMTEICNLMHSPKSSLYPILYTLTARHFLAIDQDSRYRINFASFQVGNSFLSQFNFLGEVEKIMNNITNRCLEASHFAILAEGDVLYLKKIDSPEPIRMTSHVGNRIPAYGTALGKALLIDYELPDLQMLYSEPLTSITPNTITDLHVLQKQLYEARTTGYTYEIEESTQYIRCFAVPIRKNGQIVAAFSISIPLFRFTEEKAALAKTLLFEAKARLESILSNIDTDFKNLI